MEDNEVLEYDEVSLKLAKAIIKINLNEMHGWRLENEKSNQIL